MPRASVSAQRLPVSTRRPPLGAWTSGGLDRPPQWGSFREVEWTETGDATGALSGTCLEFTQQHQSLGTVVQISISSCLATSKKKQSHARRRVVVSLYGSTSPD